MANPDPTNATPGADQPAIYEIRIGGRLSPRWRSWFEGMAIVPTDNGDTILTGPVVDQAALHGLLRKVRDLGVPLMFVRELRSPPVEESGDGHAFDPDDQEERAWQ